MAQKDIQFDREAFSCSICLDLLKVPVTIPCGHSYCMQCIKSCWDGAADTVDSCPHCRQTFTPRPVLVKNTMLVAVVDHLKKIGLQDGPADPCYAAPEDVACDVCTGRKLKACKSCLDCLVSYCEEHLQRYYHVAAMKRHKLVDPCSSLQENICSRHDEVMKMFCRTDQQSICYLCSVDEHKGHDAVSVVAERAERQKELQGRREEIQRRIQEREEDMKLLEQEVKAIEGSAKKSMQDSENMLDELILLLHKTHSEVKQQIISQQEAEVRRVAELQEKLKQEICELQRRNAVLEQLEHTPHHIHFLHNCNSVPPLSESTASSSLHVRPLSYFEDVTAAVSKLKDKLQDILTGGWTNFLKAVAEVDILLSTPEPKTRAEFLKYSREITLDPNTAHKNLVLSKGYRKATLEWEIQSYPDHPERFTDSLQVLGRQSLTGCCYWEVQWWGDIEIAVTYKNINRAGDYKECEFGRNDKSWALCECDGFHFWNKGIKTPIPAPPLRRIGVYLDHSAGILSFYGVSDTMTLLHKVKTIFTQPLYAGLLFCDSNDVAWARFCKL